MRIPDVHNFIFHPVFPLVDALNPRAVNFLLYMVNTFVGTLYMYKDAKMFTSFRPLAWAAAVSFFSSSIALQNLYGDYWISTHFMLCMLPVIYYYLVRLLDEGDWRLSLYWTSCLALCLSVFVLNGHPGLLVNYALPLTIFTLFEFRKALGKWPHLLAVVLLVTVISLPKLIDLYHEMVLFAGAGLVPAERKVRSLSMVSILTGKNSLSHFFTHSFTNKTFHFGIVFMAAALWGPFMFFRRGSRLKGMIVACVTSVVLMGAAPLFFTAQTFEYNIPATFLGYCWRSW